METTSTVQDVDAVTKKIHVTIPAEIVTKQIDSAIVKFGKTVRIKGFREGKAPRAIVERMYGEHVRAEVHKDLVSEAIQDAAKQHSLSIVGSPQVNLSKIESGKPFEFAVDVSIYPKPEIKGYESIDVTVPKREVTSEEVDAVVEYLRKNKATIRPLEGRTTLKSGDVAQAEFVVVEEGGTPSKPEPYSFCLGEGQLPKEVEAVLEGMAIGESREAVVTPEVAEGAEEKGRSVTYTCTLKSLSERILPELDDAFVKLVEPSVATVLELKVKIRESLEQEKERERTSDLNAAVLDKLLESNDFQVPQVLVDDEIRGLLVSRGFVDPKKMNIDALPMDVFRKELGEAALKRVRGAIVIDRIVENEGLKLSKEDMETSIRQIAQSMNMSVQQTQQSIFQKDRAMQFMVESLRNKGLEFLRGRAKVTVEEPKPEGKKKRKS